MTRRSYSIAYTWSVFNQWARFLFCFSKFLMFHFTKRNETLNLLKKNIHWVHIYSNGSVDWLQRRHPTKWPDWVNHLGHPPPPSSVLGQQQKIKVKIFSCLFCWLCRDFFCFPVFSWSERRAERKRCGSERRHGPWVTWWVRMGGGGGVVGGDPPHFHSLLLLFSRSLHWMSPPL